MSTIATPTSEKTIDTAESLLLSNEQYYHTFTQKPFFKMIASGLLNQDEKKRDAFFNYVQIFSDYFQTMMQTRQAACRDEKFYFTFLTHFMDELGHDDLLRQRQKITQVWDPILVAVCTWFVHQMQVLDNIEKAVVMHLVLEKTGDFYHSLANKKLSQHIESNYYEVHAEHDEDHTTMILDLLPGYPDFVYQRLNKLLYESWHMMYTMVDRVHELVMRA
ncbi:MAG: hypothetical protein COY58_04790 [Gammaproteobacteria bacterium CG_4_10_14_0_8_um_filter_38_16]|nr:MAG: hypothetical protein COY58_04790 [Gammaproteobacteria bacterium CG_4_10_14_0_8_um_filter_38_16]PJA03174.1 MAG: hypothetical protein COX72_06745 [Gammaproteobacteria bacterium CG_4_10_14_0_2_um_filter_38_22]PJB09966.1 MAG: hypothetical protein CO120_07345 [Gammaproteobacteria bacterium CG_4_9_14_3_um_filter_38_9]